MPEPLPPDWRERFLDTIRGIAPARPEWFTGGPGMTPELQATVYTDQYRMRLGDALRDEVVGLRHHAGEALEPLLFAFLRDHPSRTWTLNRVADGFADWLAGQGAPALWIELARLDHAVQAGFEAADGERLEPARLSGMPPLRLQPHASLLRTRHNVHELRSAALLDEPVPSVVEGDFPLVVFRVDRGMRHRVLDPALYVVLEEIGRGSDVGAALDRSLARGVPPEVLLPNLATWFAELAERDILGLA